ncbi:MAG TPA: RdgB/HAM1 family non-canonical purine NTP pyrophosphatase [Saprospiraceae bacterium]|nr:RdgB/HAM1 family non-canonical purine NTP pyrophosphatase [Saprospiraceae bacterium]
MRIVFATNNLHKIQEINAILGTAIQIVGLRDIGCSEALPETQDTLSGNALQKARYVAEYYGVDCFSEDTGLEIEALHGAPGVDTAHYAGPARDPQANMQLVLRQLQGNVHRAAQFRTVIALYLQGKEHLFEGVVRGQIAVAPRGQGGFGYDPIFIPEGYTQTFSELPADVKNRISHRAKAAQALTVFLSELKN